MFPDKIDKVLLDGVMDAQEYYHMYAGFSFRPGDDNCIGFGLRYIF